MILLGALGAMAGLAATTPLLTRRLGTDAGYVLAAGFLGVGGVLVTRAPAVLGGDPVTARWAWLPTLDVTLALRLDGLAGLFCVLVLGVGTLIMAYCPRYLKPGDPVTAVYTLLTLFALAMLVLVLSADLVLLYVAWELTTICSFALIATAGPAAVKPARRALVVTVIGGLALLVAVVLLAVAAGTTDLHAILAEPEVVLASPLAGPIGALVAVAAFTKSAQFPLHFWLPGAMVAITPVSAYLHAATMVKAGIYLLMRFSPLFAATDAWSVGLVTVGLTSAIVGAFLALREHDLKAILAQSTVSQLGLLVAVIGVGTPTALAAAMLHTFAHALFKATLFMLVGIIDHETGSRDIRELSGLRRVMPVTAAVTGLAALSMAGVPPMLGFVSKEYLFQGLLETTIATWAGPLAGGLGVAASALTFAYGARILHGVFGGRTRQPDLYEPSWAFLLPAALPAAAGLVLGLGVPLLRPGVSAAAASVVPDEQVPLFSFWHGWSPELLMSAITIAVGLTLFRWRAPIDRALQRVRLPDGGDLFDRAHDAVVRLGNVVGRPDRAPALAGHLARPLVALIALAVAGMLLVDDLPAPAPTVQPLDWPVLALLALTVAGVVLARTALAALGLVGVVGLVVAVWFLLIGAPDVALTLLLVEVLTAVIAVLVLRRLPGRLARSGGRRSAATALLAVTAGLAAGLATFALTGRRGRSDAGEYFLDNAVAETGGTNVVNTILVDFRGMDTLGEAVVLGAAALGLLVLLDRRGTRRVPLHRTATAEAEGVVLYVGGRVLVPLMAALSAYLLWRGHDEPGGGFIAALVAGAAVSLHQLAHGRTDRRTLLRPELLVGTGLLLALGAGAGAALQGDPFLTPFDIPVLDLVGLGSAFVFDLGVYLLVLGMLVAGIDRLAAAPPSPAGRPTVTGTTGADAVPHPQEAAR